MNTHPLQHLSIRVPWHDQAWNGSVCKCPSRNTSCLKLRNISESKDETAEAAVAGCSIQSLEADQYPPCVKERGTFMANFPFTRKHAHPYAKEWSKTHQHFKPTELNFPAYGAAALPFRWMSKDLVWGCEKKGERIDGLIERFPLEGVSEGHEPGEAVLGFKSSWVQDHRNHRALLNCFWEQVKPEESLVFFYAKQVPHVEDTGKRVIVGVGRVKSVGGLTEYEYDAPPGDKLRSLLWERMVVHSIRPDFKDGFLMPYHEALEKCDDGRAFDPAEVVAFAPEDRFYEFSYATEHVGHDAAIDSLLACRDALLRAEKLFDLKTAKQLEWIDGELGRLWEKRGPFPGLGAVLSATGIKMGNFIAQAINEKAADEANPWQIWDTVLTAPEAHLPKELAKHIDGTIAKSWQRLSQERRQFLELLSRIDLSAEQAEFLAIPEERAKADVLEEDDEFLENPYLIYEATRLTATPVAIRTVDRGLFPSALIQERFPIPEPSRVKTAVDERRLRALVVRELESAALNGDTLRPREDIISSLRKGEENEDDGRTKVSADLLGVAEDDLFPGVVRVVPMADDRPAYQLERLAAVAGYIRSRVEKRMQGKRHDLDVDWAAELDNFLGPITDNDAEGIEAEERARGEKTAALAELAAARFSVLIGSAGTGKTTLLSVLCRRSEIQSDGVLLLAPTGKARVRMEAIAKEAGIGNYEAYTLAQFLSASGRYVGLTQRYTMVEDPPSKGARTVIIDECSMLTEEMTASLLSALDGVHRLIFVGDSRQLPPIGAGRPFVDIIKHIEPEKVESLFPKVGASYAELTVPRRQGSGERDDLLLAAWFGGNSGSPGDDEVFEILSGNRKSEHVRFVQWDTPDDLERLLPEVLSETLEFDVENEEWQNFALSLGGQLDAKGSAWFNVAWGDRRSSGKAADNWQILSPVRQQPWGVDPLNRMIHVRYKGHQIEQARNPKKYRSIPKPMGDAQIIYGDKVIHHRNWTVPKKRIYPEPESAGYLANGEIGMVVGHRKTKKRSWKPDYMEIEFSTQIKQVVKFYNSDFGEEGNASLDLAYALTIHKSQGSEFGKVFLILPKSPLMLTRELLYTALTRQKKQVVVLHQGSATDLQKLSSERYSAAAARLTNLFKAPKPVEIGDRFLEEGLIHRTSRGEAVRSKSEVIVANLMHAHGIDYHYEYPLEIDGYTKYPDFTIEDDDSGVTYYWEHCGMLMVLAYSRRWEAKKVWYRERGILPIEEGGGPNGTLLVSVDKPDGGIDSAAIDKIIHTIKD